MPPPERDCGGGGEQVAVQAVGSVSAIADFAAGAVGGVAICVITHPFDTVGCRQLWWIFLLLFVEVSVFWMFQVKTLLQADATRFPTPLSAFKAVVRQSVRRNARFILVRLSVVTQGDNHFVPCVQPLALFRGMSSPLATIPVGAQRRRRRRVVPGRRALCFAFAFHSSGVWFVCARRSERHRVLGVRHRQKTPGGGWPAVYTLPHGACGCMGGCRSVSSSPGVWSNRSQLELDGFAFLGQ